VKKILDITERLKDKKHKDHAEDRRQRIETVLKMVQCSSCHLKCGMCGEHLEVSESSCPGNLFSLELHLCESCDSEFQAFTETRKGKTAPDSFWHNSEWMALWSTWEEYQEAILNFKKSNEFKRLTREFEND